MSVSLYVCTCLHMNWYLYVFIHKCVHAYKHIYTYVHTYCVVHMYYVFRTYGKMRNYVLYHGWKAPHKTVNKSVV